MDSVVKTRLWFYSKNIEGVSSSLQISSKEKPLANALKHWAVVLDYMCEDDPKELDKRILYEANNEQGYLVAEANPHGTGNERKWKNSSGFERADHGVYDANEERAKN